MFPLVARATAKQEVLPQVHILVVAGMCLAKGNFHPWFVLLFWSLGSVNTVASPLVRRLRVASLVLISVFSFANDLDAAVCTAAVTPAHIQKAYKTLSRRFHPDKPGGDEAIFIDLVKARDGLLLLPFEACDAPGLNSAESLLCAEAAHARDADPDNACSFATFFSLDTAIDAARAVFKAVRWLDPDGDLAVFSLEEDAVVDVVVGAHELSPALALSVVLLLTATRNTLVLVFVASVGAALIEAMSVVVGVVSLCVSVFRRQPEPPAPPPLPPHGAYHQRGIANARRELHALAQAIEQTPAQVKGVANTRYATTPGVLRAHADDLARAVHDVRVFGADRVDFRDNRRIVALVCQHALSATVLFAVLPSVFDHVVRVVAPGDGVEDFWALVSGFWLTFALVDMLVSFACHRVLLGWFRVRVLHADTTALLLTALGVAFGGFNVAFGRWLLLVLYAMHASFHIVLSSRQALRPAYVPLVCVGFVVGTCARARLHHAPSLSDTPLEITSALALCLAHASYPLWARATGPATAPRDRGWTVKAAAGLVVVGCAVDAVLVSRVFGPARCVALWVACVVERALHRASVAWPGSLPATTSVFGVN